jgi:hypothetical protein
LSKLKFALALPIMQFLLALTAVLWYFELPERHPASALLFRPAVSSFYHGMNAPAWIISVLISEAIRSLILGSVPSRPDWSSLSVYGIPVAETLFLVLVAVLWFLVGRAIDQRRLAGARSGKTTWVGVILNTILLLLGVVLMVGAANGIGDLRSPAQLLGTRPFIYFSIPAEILLIAWSVLLILLPGKKLVCAFRPGQSNPTSAGCTRH